MTDPITKAHAAVDYVHSEHRRQIREKNRQINALQAEKGELAITDEMVGRAARSMAMREMPVTYSSNPATTAAKFSDLAREVLHAALTEPPARPEGAEDIEALIREAVTASGTLDDEALADYLAARLTDPTRKEA